MKRTVTTTLIYFIVFSAFAQEDSSYKKTHADRFCDGEMPLNLTGRPISAILSNSIYNGRKDSVATPYITPMIGYYDKSGFFIDASLSYLAKAGSSRIDMYNIDAGYDY